MPAVISRLASHNEELAAENDDLRKELDKQKSKRWTLRDKHLAEQLAEYHAQHPPEPERHSQPQEEARPSEGKKNDTTVKQSPAAKTLTSPSAATPAPSKLTTTATPEPPSTIPRWRQLLSSLGGFSPFPSRRSHTQRIEPANKQAPSTESPLGELPQNRKRAAPSETEQETPSKKAKTPEPEPAPAPRSEPPQTGSRHLDTISEQAELPATDFAAQTPTRPSRIMPPAQTERPARTADFTPRRRTIKDVRASQVTRTPLPTQGLRRWQSTSKPREPNADKRLARMQQLEKLMEQKKQMEEQIAKLAAEQEADGIDTRKRKRVKVDELAYIPHNNPGDAKSTFRVPEWDSDDEMEVDEAVPVRPNVFSVNAETQPAASPAKAAPITQPAPSLASQGSLPPKSMFAKPASPFKAAPTAPLTTINEEATSTAAKADLFKPAVPKADLLKPAAPSALSPAAPKTSLFQSAASQTSASKPALSVQEVVKTFSFPTVGARQSDDWSEVDKIAAGEKFARGFNSWMAVGLAA